MNKWLGIARLASEPEIRVTQDGKNTVARFRVAVDIGKDKANFFAVTAWNKTAEFCEKYLHKGTKVGIEGQLRTDEYTNRDGQKVTSVYILADKIEFCESKKADAPTEKAEWQGIDDIDSAELPFNF